MTAPIPESTHKTLPVDRPMAGIRLLPRAPVPGSDAARKVQWLAELGESRKRQQQDSQHLQAIVSSVGAAVRQAQATVAQRLDELSGLTVDLALHVAREIVGDALDEGMVDPTATVARCLRDALTGPDGDDLMIHLNPEDLGLVMDRLAEHPELKEQLARATIRPDTSLTRGEVRAETGLGRLHYDPRAVFERVAEAVRSAAVSAAQVMQDPEAGR